MKIAKEIFNENCTLINKNYGEYIIRDKKKFIKDIEENASEQTAELKKDLKDAETMFEKMEQAAFNLQQKVAKLGELVKMQDKLIDYLFERLVWYTGKNYSDANLRKLSSKIASLKI